MCRTRLADAKQIFGSRIQGFNEQVGIDDNDAGVQVVDNGIACWRLVATAFLTAGFFGLLCA